MTFLITVEPYHENSEPQFLTESLEEAMERGSALCREINSDYYGDVAVWELRNGKFEQVKYLSVSTSYESDLEKSVA